MYREKKVCVVVPAYNEELLISKTIQTLPNFVDQIVVVDDGSADKTVEIVKTLAEKNPRILLIRLEKNMGVGAAVRTGYIWCRDNDIDIAVVMNGDNQMDPDDLPDLLNPIVENRADYTKGNRLVTGEAWHIIPRIRYLGNSVLTFMTKIASGYWFVTDSQSGYTAMNRKALHILPLENIYHGYGMPNDILVRCNILDLRVTDVPVKPIRRKEQHQAPPRHILDIAAHTTSFFAPHVSEIHHQGFSSAHSVPHDGSFPDGDQYSAHHPHVCPMVYHRHDTAYQCARHTVLYLHRYAAGTVCAAFRYGD